MFQRRIDHGYNKYLKVTVLVMGWTRWELLCEGLDMGLGMLISRWEWRT